MSIHKKSNLIKDSLAIKFFRFKVLLLKILCNPHVVQNHRVDTIKNGVNDLFCLPHP